MQGHIRFDNATPEIAATRFIELLAEDLHRARPSSMQVDGRRLLLRAGFFRFVASSNLLVCVTSATIRAEPTPGGVVVHFDVRLTQLIAFCCVANVLFLILPLSQHDRPTDFAFAVSAVVWVWLFGMNYLQTRTRLTRSFRKAASRVASIAAPPQERAN